MPKMDKQTLLHIAELSKLSFTDDEADAMMEQMSDIITLMDTIQEFDIVYDDTKDKNEIPFNALREDVPAPSFPTERLLQNTEPGGDNDCYRIPKMME